MTIATETLAAIESELWARIGNLLVMAPRMLALKTKLGDPALANHPKRDDAVRRYALMKTRRISCMERIAALWEMLPEEGRRSVTIRTDFPTGVDGVAFARAVWDVAKRPDDGESAPCPF